MEKIKKFIEENWNKFSNLENSEVEEYSINEIDSEIVQCLKGIESYHYKGIMVYYSDFLGEVIGVENELAEE
jgi:hypothetical protein